MFDAKEVIILERIGQYFLAENNGDLRETERKLRKMEITQIFNLNHEIIIVLRRPGLLIGSYGKNIDGLTEYLGRSIKIIEDSKPNIYDFLIPSRRNNI